MSAPDRPPPFLLAGDPALDFLNTVAAPWGREIEWIGDGGDLLAWLDIAALAPAPVLARFGSEKARARVNSVAAEARELREWFRGFVGAYAGRPLGSSALADLGALNRLLASDDAYRQIKSSDSVVRNDGAERPLRWRRKRRWHSPDSLLLPIAEAIGDLVCDVGLEHVKLCDGPTCTLWFLDVSQNHSRRWCSMAVCGNRAKAAAHRARRRVATAR